MLPIVATLLANGLGILGNAVMAKGKEVIEEKLNIKLKEDPSPEELMKYKQAEMEHEEFLVNASLKAREQEMQFQINQDNNVTDRWKVDMLSDSWLSKNIRPMILLFLLGIYSIFSIASGFDFLITQAYVELLAQMLMLVMGAYFGGRTLEKIADMHYGSKKQP